jgi:hypothetical protein
MNLQYTKKSIREFANRKMCQHLSKEQIERAKIYLYTNPEYVAIKLAVMESRIKEAIEL